VGGSGKKDTLCYATQVNQDALSRALAEPLDAAIVIGGKNSSNTYQLFRLCEEKMGARAFFIQSEENISGRHEVHHYVFPAGNHGQSGEMERRAFPHATIARFDNRRGVVSDGLIQQVVARINSFFPPERLRAVARCWRSVVAGGAGCLREPWRRASPCVGPGAPRSRSNLPRSRNKTHRPQLAPGEFLAGPAPAA